MIFLNQSLPEPHPALEACVIVPAKNEAEGLTATLMALADQVDAAGRPLSREYWEVLLLINNSRDESLVLADDFRRSHPWFPLHVAEHHFEPDEAHIGHVRKILMDAACERLAWRAKELSLILSTDADTEVARDWVAQNRAEAAQGAEAIGGRISLRHRDLRELDPQTRAIQLWNDQYNLLVSWLEDRCDPQAHDRWPRHHQHFGGSLAVKPEIYRRVGGLPPRKTLEDVAFYEALLRHDVKFRHSPEVCVHTSGRLEGRTAVGLAEQLLRWSQGSSKIAVPSVVLLETLFSLRKRMRSLWRRVQAGERVSRSALESLAVGCGALVEEVEAALACRWFGTAFESLQVRHKLENGLFQEDALQPLKEAVHHLQMRFRQMQVRATGELQEVQSGIGAP